MFSMRTKANGREKNAHAPVLCDRRELRATMRKLDELKTRETIKIDGKNILVSMGLAIPILYYVMRCWALNLD